MRLQVFCELSAREVHTSDTMRFVGSSCFQMILTPVYLYFLPGFCSGHAEIVIFALGAIFDMSKAHYICQIKRQDVTRKRENDSPKSLASIVIKILVQITPAGVVINHQGAAPTVAANFHWTRVSSIVSGSS